MKAFALLLAVAIAPAASAQDTTTQCRWIGNIWSCDSQTREKPEAKPTDQGSILRSGASVVPPYSPRSVERPASGDPYQMPQSDKLTVTAILNVCPKDDVSPVPVEQFPPDLRKMVSSLCFAYAAGRREALGR